MRVPDTKLMYLTVEELRDLAVEVQQELEETRSAGLSTASLQLDLDLVQYHLAEAQAEGRYAPVAETEVDAVPSCVGFSE